MSVFRGSQGTCRLLITFNWLQQGGQLLVYPKCYQRMAVFLHTEAETDGWQPSRQIAFIFIYFCRCKKRCSIHCYGCRKKWNTSRVSKSAPSVIICRMPIRLRIQQRRRPRFEIMIPLCNVIEKSRAGWQSENNTALLSATVIQQNKRRFSIHEICISKCMQYDFSCVSDAEQFGSCLVRTRN